LRIADLLLLPVNNAANLPKTLDEFDALFV